MSRLPRSTRPVLLLMALVALAGCDSSGDRPTYDLVLYGTEGALVTTGRLTLDAPIEPRTSVFGTYRLADPNVTSNQSGALRADCSGGPVTDDDDLRIHIDLDVDDAGLILEGGCVEGVRGGVWSRITIAGGLPGGTFDLR